MGRILIETPEIFDYQLNLQFLKRSPHENLHTVEGDTVLKAIEIEDQKILIRVKNGSNRLIIEFLNGDPATHIRNKIKNYVIDWFDLATDLTPFYKLASKDPLLKTLVTRFYGYRIVGQPNLYESLIWAVIGQQINLTFAHTLKRRFVEHFGERLVWNNESFFLFPKPRLVAGITREQLLPLQFSRQKSDYVIGISDAFAKGLIDQEKLNSFSIEKAKEELMKVKGIGNWTANYGLMKTFRYPDAFPLEDAGLHNAIKNVKKMDRKPTLDEVKKIFKKYKGWEAYATLYFWKSL